MSDLTSKMAARVKAEPTKRAAEAFRSPTDDMQRATVYLPRATVRGLKQAALDQDTSMSKILTDLAEQWLAQNVKT
ncbi:MULTISPECIES: hypothetical protein [Mycolicibacterium]|jgi:hypothetical protein|uniref:CopG family transcriptional regulator n=1 Tax=Mycolicibacterium rhodesiae TaxID=36814 RepID=A0A1X0IIF0_MYCRH|nr:hypothetical protein [Mycolicibacterium rhodesiae]MCV7343318.1 hypothetical protein [Mycolicibacterium rhodesiae]ORB47040.1 hypothetical protein BST42_28440 [Mycolicibacterium rhodesiae]